MFASPGASVLRRANGIAVTTTDPRLRSWLPVPADSDFPIQNLPYGAFERDATVRIGIAIGDRIFDLAVAADAGLFDAHVPEARRILGAAELNPLLEAGPGAWRAVRARASELLAANDTVLHDARIAEGAFVSRPRARMRLPFAVRDFVDFYSSIEHARNVGRILRPGTEPLLPNWRYLPVGYHGRAGSVVAGGTAVARPCGQREIEPEVPRFGPTEALDFELEIAFVTGEGPQRPATLRASDARAAIFGVALLNDWSARDVQAWEYRPLGPFLGKSFATTLGPWVVALEALEPFRVAAPVQDPPPFAHLATHAYEAYDVALEATLASAAMRARGEAALVVTRTNFRDAYWTMAQQLAHVASNGARVRAGDLYGSGTLSGAAPDSFGSLIELTWNGARPLALRGDERRFLEDGDEVVLRGRCTAPGATSIGFGETRGVIVPAVGYGATGATSTL